jgi:SAM-dependent methyltransferase
MKVGAVVPVFRNTATLRELHRRLGRALEGFEARQIVYVDDGCDRGSGEVLGELAEADPSVVVVALGENVGQHAATLIGLERTDGDWTVVLDADLQDPPEAIPELIAAASPGVDAVFAGRRGDYEPRLRLVTGRLYRRLLRLVAGTPVDAGAFVALSRRMVERLVEMRSLAPLRRPALVAMIGCAGLEVASVPVERAPRPIGGSTYTSARRARSGLEALLWAASWKLRRRSRRTSAAIESRIESHNVAQRRYYEQPKPKMVPGETRYLERHVDELMTAAEIRPGERVLEVGCGMGRYTLLLAARGVRVEGIDISRTLLDRLEQFDAGRFEIPLHHADVLDPPAELAGRFDAAVGLFALHHVHEIAPSLGSIARLLRPGGRVAFCEPNPYNPLYYVQMAVRPGMTWSGDKGMLRIRRRPLTRALAEAGFTDLYWKRFGFFPPFLTNSRLGALERPLESCARWRPALPFQLFGGRLQ